MKRNIKSLIGYTIGATNGEIGKVKEFYFDDENWAIRYLIVDTGNWLSGSLLLISSESLLTPDWENEVFPVNLTKEQIMNCPDINTEKLVSRQEELKSYKYSPRVNYLDGTSLKMGMPVTETIAQSEPKDGNMNDKETDKDLHLRSTDNISGYCIKATDGEIGDVEDFIVDDRTWKINFLVVDTGNWFPGKKVLLTPKRIKEIDWQTNTVFVNTSVEHVTKSPEYNPAQPMNEIYEEYIHNYYGQMVL